MTDAEKARYATKAANDKKRFEDELAAQSEEDAAYNAWMHFVAENWALYKELIPIHFFKALGVVWRNMKDVEKEPYVRKTKPKGPRNAWNVFVSENWSKYERLPPGQVRRALSADWRSMNDAEKEPYVTKAADEKKRFEDALAEFEEELGATRAKVKRARTAYNYFCKERMGGYLRGYLFTMNDMRRRSYM
eukprot:CAMPEP_0172736510 /NCGR_PEP_ID=MMETSP1074-20121228/115252_1 /TAXON_ID=2916 /ORGANISM="Ceratium fusus, Strain PA161109" /LENGTH=190 /DNA_ID=CAMNT_0013565725 /DNA_START=140 /DNA_END=712 /DNA_ORIENTATION=+